MAVLVIGHTVQQVPLLAKLVLVLGHTVKQVLLHLAFSSQQPT